MIGIGPQKHVMEYDDELFEAKKMGCDICRNIAPNPTYRHQKAQTLPRDPMTW
jgi:hypothetical protein